MTVLRRPGIASVAVLAGLGAAFAVANAVAPGWSRRAGLDVWNWTAERDACRAEADRRQELFDRHADLEYQSRASSAVAARLVADRVPFPDAVDEVMRINRERIDFYVVLATAHPGVASERGLAARYLISKVHQQLDDDPSRLAEVMCRLEAEFGGITNDPPVTH